MKSILLLTATLPDQEFLMLTLQDPLDERSSRSHSVKISVFKRVAWGDHVKVVGSADTLGAWDLEASPGRRRFAGCSHCQNVRLQALLEAILTHSSFKNFACICSHHVSDNAGMTWSEGDLWSAEVCLCDGVHEFKFATAAGAWEDCPNRTIKVGLSRPEHQRCRLAIAQLHAFCANFTQVICLPPDPSKAYGCC